MTAIALDDLDVIVSAYHIDKVENQDQLSRIWRQLGKDGQAVVINLVATAIGLPATATTLIQFGNAVLTNSKDNGEEHTGAYRAPDGYSICTAVWQNPSVNCNGAITGSYRTKDDPASGGFDAFWYYIVVPKPAAFAGRCWAEGTLILSFVRYDEKSRYASKCGKSGVRDRTRLKVKAMLTYPMTSGRNFDEVLRLLDSCQLTAKHQVAIPVNWKPGEDVIIAGSVSDNQAREKYPGGWKAPKPYLRIVPQPH